MRFRKLKKSIGVNLSVSVFVVALSVCSGSFSAAQDIEPWTIDSFGDEINDSKKMLDVLEDYLDTKKMELERCEITSHEYADIERSFYSIKEELYVKALITLLPQYAVESAKAMLRISYLNAYTPFIGSYPISLKARLKQRNNNLTDEEIDSANDILGQYVTWENNIDYYDFSAVISPDYRSPDYNINDINIDVYDRNTKLLYGAIWGTIMQYTRNSCDLYVTLPGESSRVSPYALTDGEKYLGGSIDWDSVDGIFNGRYKSRRYLPVSNTTANAVGDGVQMGMDIIVAAAQNSQQKVRLVQFHLGGFKFFYIVEHFFNFKGELVSRFLSEEEAIAERLDWMAATVEAAVQSEKDAIISAKMWEEIEQWYEADAQLRKELSWSDCTPAPTPEPTPETTPTPIPEPATSY